MPKRKSKDKKRHIAKKIRRLEKRLDFCSSESSFDEADRYHYDDGDHHRERYYESCTPAHLLPASDSEIPILPLSDSEASIDDTVPLPKSVVVVGNAAPSTSHHPNENINTVNVPTPGPSVESTVGISASTLSPGPSMESTTLPADILEALGDPKGKEEVFGPKIPEEIAERWGRVLVDGLTKEQKLQMAEKYLIPDNFRLAKAPLLNPEVIPVLNESARNRDKLLEKSQNQLGLGIAELTNLASMVIHEDPSKIEILKRITTISQIFLDLHHEDTKRRRKLVTASFDKKFVQMISDVKRDVYLFGANLGEKIKASKMAERSGLQIRRSDPIPSTSRRYPQQGNWKGPPRVQAQRAHRQGGPRGRYSSQLSRRGPPATERHPRMGTKNLTKTQKP